MNENILTFGPGARLTGTLTRPDGPSRGTAILLLNAGVIHRMGPHRINVKLARALAAQGHTVLRLDLSGQGDSEASDSTLSYDQQAVADLQAAMDHIQRLTSIQTFALAGICSAAHHGVSTAMVDDRLKALWLMDTHAYPNKKTSLVRAWRQLNVDPSGTLMGWAGRLPGLLLKRLRPAPRQSEPMQQLLDNPYASPTRDEFAARLKVIVDKQVRVQLVYSGSFLWLFNYAGQWRDTFKAYGAVADLPCDLIPDVDHTVSTLHAQRRLIDAVTRFAAHLN
ncbi:MAG: alpha/beta hydrolase [Aquabacterium sp.]|uniref:alpha/beta hydrolase n=1 Tax=Aquabacterium sp. TaxID=1872578 RepID=UPI0025B84E68|nr:alpha/beta fold hydrolase [Aquabacterium sp.]MBI5924232.1 alpha/beta hydrolase [Aquabacterium sp.]